MFTKSPKTKATHWVRRFSVALVGMLLLGASSVGAGGDAEITVPISTVRNGKGMVFVALYERGNWLQPGQYLAAQRVKAERGTVYARFKNIPRGNYGVAVFHDENANNRVDTNLLGLPAEGYGFSRVSPRRKPKWEEISVSAQPTAYAPIRLRY
jgi:uncharacterized protein (DUF2141 family)